MPFNYLLISKVRCTMSFIIKMSSFKPINIMNRIYNLLAVLIILLLSSCNGVTENSLNEIGVSLSNKKIKIVNESDRTIYLFIVEQNYAALIDWFPGYDGLRVEPGKFIVINYQDVPNGKITSVDHGDNIIIYYWERALKNNPSIRNKVIEL